MIWCAKDRNAETLRTQSSCPRISSALSASPRFKISPAEHGSVLTPGRYVGAEEVEDDGVPFAEKMEGLTRELATQFHESEKLQNGHRVPHSGFAVGNQIAGDVGKHDPYKLVV